MEGGEILAGGIIATVTLCHRHRLVAVFTFSPPRCAPFVSHFLSCLMLLTLLYLIGSE